MLRTIAISSLIFAGAATTAWADVYRWVDEHGGLHYTDQWVPGAQLIKSSKPRPVTADSDDTARAFSGVQAEVQRGEAQLAQENAARSVKEDVAKIHEQQCKDARERYEKSIAARRISKPPPQGQKPDDKNAERVYMSDEEMDAYRLQARTAMDDACRGQPPPKGAQ